MILYSVTGFIKFQKLMKDIRIIVISRLKFHEAKNHFYINNASHRTIINHNFNTYSGLYSRLWSIQRNTSASLKLSITFSIQVIELTVKYLFPILRFFHPSSAYGSPPDTTMLGRNLIGLIWLAAPQAPFCTSSAINHSVA